MKTSINIHGGKSDSDQNRVTFLINGYYILYIHVAAKRDQ